MDSYTHRVTSRGGLKKDITNLSLLFHISALLLSQLYKTAWGVTRCHSLSHPHIHLCTIDSITYFLPTVIPLCNCLQSVYPGNSWALSALFWTQNKDFLLIGPSHPLSLLLHLSDLCCLQAYRVVRCKCLQRWGKRILHWHRGHLSIWIPLFNVNEKF